MTNNADAQIARQWAEGFIKHADSAQIVDADALTAARHILATTTPPTMADVTEDEREACQWMQATFTKSPHEHIITQVFGKKARLLRRSDGAMFEVHHDEVIPHPDLPRLKWPTSAPSTEDTPEPEDVPESTPSHPEVLTTRDDYESAPAGTVVAEDDASPWIKDNLGFWIIVGDDESETSWALAGIRRRVLRWGWEA